jgi:hypothetical protein
MSSLCHTASESTQTQHRCGTSSTPDRRPEVAALEQEIKQGRRAVLVVNTRSRHGARTYSEAKRLLAEGGITLDAAYPVRNAERLQAIVREEIAKGTRRRAHSGPCGGISTTMHYHPCSTRRISTEYSPWCVPSRAGIACQPSAANLGASACRT